MNDMFPASWKQLPLEDCTAAILDYHGVAPKKTTFGVPLITAKIVKNGRILDVEEYIAVEEYDDWMRRGLPEKGDVVLVDRLRAALAPLDPRVPAEALDEALRACSTSATRRPT